MFVASRNGLLACGLLSVVVWTGLPPLCAEQFTLESSSVRMTFREKERRLGLVQLEHLGHAPLLYSDPGRTQAGAGALGNPLALVIRSGPYARTNGLESFHVTKLEKSVDRLRAYLEHDAIPLLIGLDITVEGAVISWLGQALWNGEEKIEAEIFFPLLSRVRFDEAGRDRALFPQTSGSVREPLSMVNYAQNYVGRMASPVFLVEGGGRGIAWLDDNRADYAPDPGAACLRSYLVANRFPPRQGAAGGDDGPIVGVGHTRVFRPISEFGGETTYNAAERRGDLPLKKLGDAIDLGPVRTHLYGGSWKAGADWLRQQRAWIPMRVSPADWYRRTTFVAEEGAPNARGLGFLALPEVLEQKRKLGADLFFIVGFSDPEIVGSAAQARGDYFYPAQSLGGPGALRQGVEATHRAGGHVLYYVEGLIVWKRSRIGRSQAEDWALMEADGRLTEHYKGFYHACPADPEYQEWLAQTCAELLRTSGADGFFVDSELATYNHRCFNPRHRHPHPDVWTWGVRQLFKRVRTEMDKVNPNAVLLIEGCGDIGREFGDGFIAHGHFWTENTFSAPLVRFLHPDMRQFESWGYVPRDGNVDALKRWFIWNSVQGHRAYAHNAHREEMAAMSAHVRRYYDAFPEICDAPMSALDVPAQNGIGQLFESSPRVLTLGNTNAVAVEVVLTLPVPGSLLLDRVAGTRVPVSNGRAQLKLEPWSYQAFEIRP